MASAMTFLCTNRPPQHKKQAELFYATVRFYRYVEFLYPFVSISVFYLLVVRITTLAVPLYVMLGWCSN